MGGVYLPVANVASDAQNELLYHPVKDVSQGEEGQEAVLWCDLDVAQIHKTLQGGHRSDQCVVGQYNPLGVSCKERDADTLC